MPCSTCSTRRWDGAGADRNVGLPTSGRRPREAVAGLGISPRGLRRGLVGAELVVDFRLFAWETKWADRRLPPPNSTIRVARNQQNPYFVRRLAQDMVSGRAFKGVGVILVGGCEPHKAGTRTWGWDSSSSLRSPFSAKHWRPGFGRFANQTNDRLPATTMV